MSLPLRDSSAHIDLCIAARKESLMRKTWLVALLLLVAAPLLYADCRTLDITDEFIGPFTAGSFGSWQLTPYGGTPPYTFSINSGSLPRG